MLERYSVDYGVLTATSARLYAQTSVGSVKNAMTYGKVFNPARHFAAESYGAVTELHKAVAYSMMVCGRLVGGAHINLARLQGDTVVPHAEYAADDIDVIAGFGVQPVGVGTVLGCVDGYPIKADVLAEIRVKLPRGGILPRYTVNIDIAAII